MVCRRESFSDLWRITRPARAWSGWKKSSSRSTFISSLVWRLGSMWTTSFVESAIMIIPTWEYPPSPCEAMASLCRVRPNLNAISAERKSSVGISGGVFAWRVEHWIKVPNTSQISSLQRLFRVKIDINCPFAITLNQITILLLRRAVVECDLSHDSRMFQILLVALLAQNLNLLNSALLLD